MSDGYHVTAVPSSAYEAQIQSFLVAENISLIWEKKNWYSSSAMFMRLPHVIEIALMN